MMDVSMESKACRTCTFTHRRLRHTVRGTVRGNVDDLASRKASQWLLLEHSRDDIPHAKIRTHKIDVYSKTPLLVSVVETISVKA